MIPDRTDVLVIGGGFYGCVLACFEADRGARVHLVEREDELLTRASYRNQARVHNGYHYPRSYRTAYRSRVNLPRFQEEFREAVDDRFTALYAIARQGSHTSAGQFRRFCDTIGAVLEPAPPGLRGLFEPRLVEGVFLTYEPVFDAVKLRVLVRDRMQRSGVTVWTGWEALKVARGGEDGRLEVTVREGGGELTKVIQARRVLNCTYSSLSRLKGAEPGGNVLKHEMTEIALVQVPDELQELGITVMDGPYFSILPFPAEGCHSLSHVRYTPHYSWNEATEPHRQPDAELAHHSAVSTFQFMVRDGARYLPALKGLRFLRTLLEVKTVLARNEVDDGRPIICSENPALPGCFAVLGSKIDNIYDVLEHLSSVAPPLLEGP